MQLSEAIMLGSTMVDPRDRDVWNRCALGMAAAATGVKRHLRYYALPAGTGDIYPNKNHTANFLKELADRFPALRAPVTHPCSHCTMGGRLGALADVIIHLHDYHVAFSPSPERWTIEQIADFVRSIERAGYVENDPQRQAQGPQLNPCAALNYFAPSLGEGDGTRPGEVSNTSEARPAPAEVPA